jgi:ATP-dependent Clp protease ATP-binding subunit ClpC
MAKNKISSITPSGLHASHSQLRSNNGFDAKLAREVAMFETFTDRSRRVLLLAQEEARLLHHNFIGTEHLLLGLLAERDGVAARALGSLAISLQVARAKVGETTAPSRSFTSDYSKAFTPRAKKVLELSVREAHELGHNYIGTEHILLGLLGEGEGVAAQLLVNFGAQLSEVRQRVIELMDGTRSA